MGIDDSVFGAILASAGGVLRKGVLIFRTNGRLQINLDLIMDFALRFSQLREKKIYLILVI